jgi:hypothetical protein
MRAIYRKIRHARYLYIKRNVEKVWGARYTLGAHYLSKNTVLRLYNEIFVLHVHTCMDRDSAVCIATRYGLNGPGIESRWRRDFLHPSRPALGPTQPPVQWELCVSRG